MSQIIEKDYLTKKCIDCEILPICNGGCHLENKRCMKNGFFKYELPLLVELIKREKLLC